jgi:hypothetical protein
MAKTTICDCVLLTVPSVEPLDTVIVMADVTDAVAVVPLPSVVLRKASEQGFSVTVMALDATEAEIG